MKIVDMRPYAAPNVVLRNPGKGIYHHYIDNGYVENGDQHYGGTPESIAAVSGINHLLIRIPWCYLEPAETRFRWEIVDNLVERFYKPHGLKFSFDVTCKETSLACRFATPEWVYLAGARGEFFLRNAKDPQGCFKPEYDDPVFLEKLEAFHRAFSERYGGQPFVEDISMGSIGDWGEGHNCQSGNETISADVLKTHIDLFRRCYPNDQLVIGDDYIGNNCVDDREREALVRYLVEYRFGMRDDSINVGWHIENFPRTFSVRNPGYFPLIAEVAPTTIELEHYGTQKDMGRFKGRDGCEVGGVVARQAIEIMKASFFSFHGFVDEWLVDNPELLSSVANRIGYWFFLDAVVYSERVFAGERTCMTLAWRNRGVAQPYIEMRHEIRLNGADGVHNLAAQGTDCRTWRGDASVLDDVWFDVPRHLPEGVYSVGVRLRTIRGETVRVAIADELRDADGFYVVGSFHVRRG